MPKYFLNLLLFFLTFQNYRKITLKNKAYSTKIHLDIFAPFWHV